MRILFTTTFSIRCLKEPNHLIVSHYFEDLIEEFFDLEIEKSTNGNGYTFKITYPAYQAQEYALRIMEYCNMQQNLIKLTTNN